MVPITSCDTAGSFLLLGCNNGSIYYIGTHRQVYVFSVCHTVYGFFFYSIIPFKPLVKCHRQRCSSLCEPSSTALAFSLQTRSNLVTLIHDDHCCAYQTFQALKQIKNEYLKKPQNSKIFWNSSNKHRCLFASCIHHSLWNAYKTTMAPPSKR